ncbi:transposase [Flavobacterium columnare]|nr:transposase [Flavobacterium columnare]
MAKKIRLSEFQYQIPFFTLSKDFDGFYAQFLKTDLGKIYLSMPFSELAQAFKLKDSQKGTHCYFSPKGKIALMMLKNYYGCSDKKLIELLNGNIFMQFFCDILIPIDKPLKNFKIVSQIRMELSKNLTIRKAQEVLAKSWIPYMGDLDKMLTDATCYESEVRFPTNQKLLWECVEWNYKQMESLCHLFKIKLPRTKYLDWCKRYKKYSKKRKKQSKHRTKVTRRLLKLLYKLNDELSRIETQNPFEATTKYRKQRLIINQVYKQQLQIFKTGKSLPNRIVSISKSYIRPIVRGKEIKQVEFGAKVNKIQIDGINFIQHIQYRAFNEGTRLQSSVFCAQNLTKTKVKILGADAIYATNKNRTFTTTNTIQTDFLRKGKAGKNEEQRKILAQHIKKERATRLEGSFGKEKEHYHLKKIKAKTQKSEILWIFFGIHTANALEIGRRIYQQQQTLVA